MERPAGQAPGTSERVPRSLISGFGNRRVNPAPEVGVTDVPVKHPVVPILEQATVLFNRTLRELCLAGGAVPDVRPRAVSPRKDHPGAPEIAAEIAGLSDRLLTATPEFILAFLDG